MATGPVATTMRERRLVERVIAKLPIFQRISSRQLAGIARASLTLNLRRGETLERRGARLPGIYTVAVGLVKLVLGGAHREERVIRLIAPGESFGEATALLATAAPCDAVALIDSRLIVIPAASVAHLMERDLRFARALAVTLAQRNLELVGEIESATMHSGTQRLAAYLGSLAGSQDWTAACTVKLPVSKTVVAARLGVKKETLSRLLHELAEQELISVARRDISILDPERLAQVAHA